MRTYAIILAAGKGTRFGESEINKTAIRIYDKSIVQLGIEKVESLVDRSIVVVGHKKESVISGITSKKVVFVEKLEQKGTGDAVKVALDYINSNLPHPGSLFIANGDHLFMSDAKYIESAFEYHRKRKNQATVITALHKKPKDLDNGRIIKKWNGKFHKIIDKAEFSPSIRRIKELNTGTYLAEYSDLVPAFSKQVNLHIGELYITDIIASLKRVSTYRVPYEKIGGGVNTKQELEKFVHTLERDIRKIQKSPVHKAIEIFILLALLLVLLGKIFFRDQDSILFLTTYGILVTLVTWTTILMAFHVYRDPYEIAKHKDDIRKLKTNLMVSCMVAVHNEEGNITRCIDSMLRQSYKNIEIIVVNDASTDNTVRELQDYVNNSQIKLINLKENVGKKRALSLAMEQANGDIFAHTDSDSVWALDAIEKIVMIFKYFPKVGAVSGHGRALNGDKNLLTKTQDSWMEGQFSIRKAFESVFGAVSCVSGPLAVFRREAVYNYLPAWADDMFLGQEFRFATDRTITGFVLGCKYIGKSLKAKFANSLFVKSVDYKPQDWDVVYCKSAKSWTIVPDTFGKLIRQQVRWKKSFIRNLFFTGTFYWRKPMPVAIYYYLHVLFVLLGPFISFRHLIYLPLRGNIFSGILYLAGIIFVGFMLGFAYKLENKDSHIWIYRPIMSLLSTLVISWLLFYSLITIKVMTWERK